MMNMLTVGPFGNVSDARAALAKLKEAGVDSNMRRRNDGGAIINAGSYLLEENATSITKKIRSMGYPVKLQKREARLPMTFVRVGVIPARMKPPMPNRSSRIRGWKVLWSNCSSVPGSGGRRGADGTWNQTR